MKDKISINERIIQFVEYLEIDMDLFAYLCDTKSDYLLNDDFSKDKDCLKKICQIYPELNSQWLKSGLGNMLGSSKAYPFNESDYHVSTELLLRRRVTKSKLAYKIKERLEIYQAYIGVNTSKLEKDLMMSALFSSCNSAVDLICRNNPNLNPLWLVNGEGDMVCSWSEFGDAIGAKYKWNTDKPLTETDKNTAIWALKSYAFRWVEGCVRKGISRMDIFEIFNEAHRENASFMKSRAGGELTTDVLKSWLYISTKLIPKFIFEFSKTK